MGQYFKWLIFLIIACLLGLIFSRFIDGTPQEITITIIASLALLRTCKEEK